MTLASTIIAQAGSGGTAVNSFQEETSNIVSLFDTDPKTEWVELIDAMITAFKDADIWDRFQLFYCLAAQAQDHGFINWKSPSDFMLTSPAGGVTHTAWSGMTGNGTNGYLESGFSPISSGIFLQDDAHLAGWVETHTNATNRFVAIGNHSALGSRNSSNQALYKLTKNGEFGKAASSATGFRAAWRSVSTTVSTYVDRSKNADQASTSAALTAGSLTIFKAATVFCPDTVSFVSCGAALTDDQMIAYYDILSDARYQLSLLASLYP